MSDYNFTNDPSPSLPTEIDASSNDPVLVDGAIQGDLLTTGFGGTQVAVTISPPTNWSVAYTTWSNGSSGVLPVPPNGREQAYTFNYELEESSTGQKKTGSGTFKVKKVT